MGLPVRSSTYLIPLIACAALSMGNQGCEEQQDNTRVLRMDVELASLKARPVQLPNGETIDFQTVSNTLFYGQVMNNKHFAISTPVPAPQAAPQRSMVANASTKSGGGEISEGDESLLARFGFDAVFVQTPVLETTRERIDFGAPVISQPAAGNNNGASASQPVAGGIPACLYNSPQAVLGGDMVSFEASRGAAVRIGYGQDGQALTPGAGGNVRFEQTKLDIRLRSDDPLSRQGVAIGDGVAYSSKVDVSVSFVPGVPVGLDFFYKTALADVIKKAMDKALDQIVGMYKSQMSPKNSWDDVWESRVLYDPVISNNDTHVAIRGGYRSSIRVGDRFRVTNTRYVWTGAECVSPLRYKIPLSNEPGALVEVITVGDNVAVAKVLENVSERAILPGATVKIESLFGAEPEAPSTPKSMRLATR